MTTRLKVNQIEKVWSKIQSIKKFKVKTEKRKKFMIFLFIDGKRPSYGLI